MSGRRIVQYTVCSAESREFALQVGTGCMGDEGQEYIRFFQPEIGSSIRSIAQHEIRLYCSFSLHRDGMNIYFHATAIYAP